MINILCTAWSDYITKLSINKYISQILALLGLVAYANAGAYQIPEAHYGHHLAVQLEPFDVS